mmetsp:Transcript_130215/g.225144  ORF Transcript_130215/g.225144 Transcript_130215/m.225144 type:complete len:237 (-) Transcript_130215:437-1147(-)
MAQKDSFPTKNLFRTSRLANMVAPRRTTSHSGLKAAAAQGWRTTMTPRKPVRVANHRSPPTCSLRKPLDSTRVKRGMVKFNVVTTEIGAIVNPLQYRLMPPASRQLRAKCRGSRLVLNESMPEANMNGSIEREAKKKRRKTICATARLPPTYFMITSLATPIPWCAKNHASPTRYFQSAPPLSPPEVAAMAQVALLELRPLWLRRLSSGALLTVRTESAFWWAPRPRNQAPSPTAA